jgi:hypothetical protein
MHGYICACMGWAATFRGILEHVALLLWCHHSEQGQHQHPRTATAHAVAVVISCPVTVRKQNKGYLRRGEQEKWAMMNRAC